MAGKYYTQPSQRGSSTDLYDAVIGSDFTYVPPVSHSYHQRPLIGLIAAKQAIHTVAIYWAILILHYCTNLLPTRTLSLANQADVGK